MLRRWGHWDGEVNTEMKNGERKRKKCYSLYEGVNHVESRIYQIVQRGKGVGWR